MHTSHTKSPGLDIRKLSLVGLMTAVLCILGPWSLALPLSPVPLSLGTLGIYFVALVLGSKFGTLSVLLYIFLGLIGLPVFTGFMSGPAKVFGPTGGYLLGYIFLAFLSGFSAGETNASLPKRILGMCLGTLICYLFGTLWLSYQLALSLGEALAVGVLPYLPGDILKMLAALTLGNKLRKALSRANLIN